MTPDDFAAMHGAPTTDERIAMSNMAVLDAFKRQVELLDGMVATLKERGYTDPESRAVATMFLARALRG